MEKLKLFLKGIVIGMANVIPGVSGGTMAVVFGIYDKFVNAINPNLKKMWKDRGFIIPLILGMLSGIALFSKIISFLFKNYPHQTYFFFFGLIIGSVPMIFGYCIKKNESSDEELNIKKRPVWLPKTSVIICFLTGLLVMLSLTALDNRIRGEEIHSEQAIVSTVDSEMQESDSANAISADLPELTPGMWFKIFFAGVVGAIVMVIPGISGSLFMLIMGVYEIIIAGISGLTSALAAGDVKAMWEITMVLLPNGIGVIIGLFTGAKLISIILKKAPLQTYGVILGLIAGSAVNIFSKSAGISLLASTVSLLCIIAGFSLAYFTSKNEA